MRTRLKSSQNAIEEYRKKHGLFRDSRDTLVSQQLSDLNSKLTAATIESRAAEANLTQVKRLLKMPNQVETASQVLQSELIRPSIGRLSGVDSASGLGELLAGVATREEVTKRDPRSTADIIVAGDDPSRNSALTDSRRFKQLLDELRAHTT